MAFDMKAIDTFLCNTIEQDEEQMREVFKLKIAYENLHIEKIESQENEAKYKQALAKSKKSYENQIAQLNNTIERYRNKIKNLEEEQKIELDENLGDSVNYKKLYLNLVESLKQNFYSPINFDKMKSPCILKSGQTIDEVDFDKLHQMRSRDPYDRTKAVDIKIPNLALRDIISTVDKIENLRKKMLKYGYSEVSSQTNDDPHYEEALQQILTHKNDLYKSSLPRFSISIKVYLLIQKHLGLFDKLQFLNRLSFRINEEYESEAKCTEVLQSLNEKLRIQQEALKKSVKELQDEEVDSALELIKYLHYNSSNWTFSLVCIELIQIITEKENEWPKSLYIVN